MWKVFWISAGIAGLVLVGLVYAGSQSTLLYKHPFNASARVEIDRETGAAVLVGFTGPDGKLSKPPADSRSQPRVEVPAREYDFGAMNPLTLGRHDFVIRNAGDAPLRLRIGSTTCKCTVAGLGKREVAPGEQTTVTLEWNTGHHRDFQHSGVVFTNDPDRKSIELVVRGRVITVFAAGSDEIVVPELAPGATAAADVLLYSQVWDRFKLSEVDCSLPGVTWELVQIDPQDAPADLGAKSAQRLRLLIPGDLPRGPFRGTVRIKAKADAEPAEHTLELPLHGTVAAPFSLVGLQTVDAAGNIDLGTLREGESKQVRLLVKVRDPQANLAAAEVTTFPQFLKATLTPRPADVARGLYDLSIDIPAGAPAGQYRGNPRAEVRIDTSDPRLGTVKLGVTFAILPATN